ncbi:DUF4233 domain-containing protein [Brevibacterium samyangense]|uniref:DUF4233 domain-containing protein n=1 Tax=Brevibacterium samyangense TaxID=366888 RepID=A0ABP5ENA3_9MICO
MAPETNDGSGAVNGGGGSVNGGAGSVNGGAPRQDRPRTKLRMMCSTILVCELLVVYFAALTGYGLGPVPLGWLLTGAGLLAVLIVVAILLLPRYRGENRPGVALGWIIQVLITAGGFVMPALFFVGLLFGVLWYAAVYWGRRMDRELTAWGK